MLEYRCVLCLLVSIVFKKIFLCAGLLAIAAQAEQEENPDFQQTVNSNFSRIPLPAMIPDPLKIDDFQGYLENEVNSWVDSEDNDNVYLREGCDSFNKWQAAESIKNIEHIIYQTYLDYYWVNTMLRNVDYSNLTEANKNYILMAFVVRDMFFDANQDAYENDTKLNKTIFEAHLAKAKRSLEMREELNKAFASDYDQRKEDVFLWLLHTHAWDIAAEAFLTKKIAKAGAQKYKRKFDAALEYLSETEHTEEEEQQPYVAIRHLPLEYIQQLYSKGYKFDRDDIGDAGATGNLEVVKFFFENDVTCSVWSKDKVFHSEILQYLFLRAVDRGQTEILEYLLGKNQNLAKSDGYEEVKPLDLAVRSGSLDVVKLLIDHGAVATDEIFLLAASRADDDHFDIVSWLLDQDPSLSNVKDIDGESVLVKAVRTEKQKVVKLLIAHGADVDDKSLCYAINGYDDCPEMAKLLIEKHQNLIEAKYHNDQSIIESVVYDGNQSEDLKTLLVERALQLKGSEFFFEQIHEGKFDFIKYLFY